MDKKSVTTLTLKQINKHTVYQYIYRQRETSKFQIVQDLNMGLSTVSQNLTTLEKEGLIERNGYFASTGGRKAQIIRIVPDRRIAIGIGILKNMFHLVAVDLYGEAAARETIPLAYEDTPEYYDTFAGEVLHFIEKNEYPTEKISGISIATQGIISPDGSSVTYGAIMGNTRMQLSDFASRLPFPCHLVHDSKAAADLELWNHPKLDSALVFLLNRNLGGAVITNHSVHQGLRDVLPSVVSKSSICHCSHSPYLLHQFHHLIGVFPAVRFHSAAYIERIGVQLARSINPIDGKSSR